MRHFSIVPPCLVGLGLKYEFLSRLLVACILKGGMTKYKTHSTRFSRGRHCQGGLQQNLYVWKRCYKLGDSLVGGGNLKQGHLTLLHLKGLKKIAFSYILLWLFSL